MTELLVHTLLEMNARKTPKKVAVVDGDRNYSYENLDKQAKRLATELIRRGLKAGDRVLIYLENSAESVIAIYAALKAGAIFVPLNGHIKAYKLGYILKDTRAAAIVTDSSRHRQVAVAMQQTEYDGPLILVTVPCGGTEDCLPEPSFFKGVDLIDFNKVVNSCKNPSVQATDEIKDGDLAALIYTSGSSGFPKGVMAAHYNMVAVTKSILQYLCINADDIVLNVLPLSFDYGLYQILMCVHCGATVVLEKSFAYPYRILELLAERRITGFPIVPTMAAIFNQLNGKPAVTFKNLRYITSTGDILTEEMIATIESFFPGVKLYSMYGLTECKRVSYLEPEQLSVRPRSVGRPIPGCKTFIAGKDGHNLGPGHVGELVVQGRHVMQGYWNAPEESARVFRHGKHRDDALLRTRDLFMTDDEGYLYFVERNSDMIKSRGERISPKEIERFLNGIEGVLQSAVVGVSDDIAGQLIRACLIPSQGKTIHPANILHLCRQNLEPSLVPDQIRILDQLPINVRGKVDRQQLAQEA